MNDFEKIGKKMPYKESDVYVDNLLERCGKNAVMQYAPHKRKVATHRIVYISTSVAAAVLVALVCFVKLMSSDTDVRSQDVMSLSQVLDSMSDEELMNVSDYNVEEIPIYTENY